MEDEKLDDFKYELAIGNILYVIEKKKELNKTEELYLDRVREYIQRVNNSLDSILAPEDGKGYIFTPHLKEVVKALANKKEDIPRKDIPKYKEEFNSINSKLENLKSNPKEFYNSTDSEYIFNFMKKIEPFFQRPSVPIMTCGGEDIPGDD